MKKFILTLFLARDVDLAALMVKEAGCE